MLISDFTYHLPDDRIARYPLQKRDASRLLTYRDGRIRHGFFSELPELLGEDVMLVFNDTRVIPARALMKKDTGAQIELLLLHPEQPTRVIQEAMLVRGSCVWECMIGNRKRWKAADTLTATLAIGEKQVKLNAFPEDLEKNLVRFTWNEDFTFLDVVTALGEIPLPPYLGRRAESGDAEQYQTVYAREHGAVAAPTAGLHFTEEVMAGLSARNVSTAFVTLHVGAGTFQPVKTHTVEEHLMHAEQVVFSRKLITDLLEHKGRTVAVGTTSLRSLESLYWFGVKLLKKESRDFIIEKMYPYSFGEQLPGAAEALKAVLRYMDEEQLAQLTGETRIFIFPGYTFRMADGLITNYHQPGSTLILLIAAFVGDAWREIYREALDRGYRFLSYGDSSLLWR